MNYSVSISYNDDSDPFFQNKITEDEYNEIGGYCDKSEKTVSCSDQVGRPTRTYSAITLAKDLFLPLTLNPIGHIKNIWAKYLVILARSIIDLVTLPIRLFTCIPRMLSNKAPSEHPLHQYLTRHGADLPNDTEHVYVSYEKQSEEEHRSNWQYVNFIEVPKYPDCYSKGCSGTVQK